MEKTEEIKPEQEVKEPEYELVNVPTGEAIAIQTPTGEVITIEQAMVEILNLTKSIAKSVA